MLETFVISFTTFFATVAPLEVATVFATLTPHTNIKTRYAIAVKGVVISSIILLSFALFGNFVLSALGISLAALRIAGGILLLLIGIDMVFARPSGGTSATKEEVDEAITSHDISVFPLATPLIAGPGSMGAAILLMANAEDQLLKEIIVISSLLIVLIITLILLLIATRLQQHIKLTGMNVISRIMGVLLSALAVQFMIDGLLQSGLA
jgi:multiple antibiotic resistance protein